MIFAGLPLFLLIIPFMELMNPCLYIYSSKVIKGNLSIHRDSGFKGNSVIEHFSFNQGVIDSRYTFHQGAESPFIFIIHQIGTETHPIDLSAYKSMTIKLREFSNPTILFFLKTFSPEVSKAGNPGSLRHNGYILNLIPGIREYTVNLEDFETGQWWYESMNITAENLPQEDFSKVISLDMYFNSSGQTDILEKPQRMVIESIAFNKKISMGSRIIFIALVVLYICLLVMALFKKFFISNSHLPLQKHIPFETYREQNLQRIRDFIQEHYHNPNISTQMIYQALGIPQKKVFSLVHTAYRMTFKQLINKMRIEESKRLLSESDLRVTDVATKVGFNELTYFNRLFKEETKMTPSEFREKYQSI